MALSLPLSSPPFPFSPPFLLVLDPPSHLSAAGCVFFCRQFNCSEPTFSHLNKRISFQWHDAQSILWNTEVALLFPSVVHGCPVEFSSDVQGLNRGADVRSQLPANKPRIQESTTVWDSAAFLTKPFGKIWLFWIKMFNMQWVYCSFKINKFKWFLLLNVSYACGCTAPDQSFQGLSALGIPEGKQAQDWVSAKLLCCLNLKLCNVCPKCLLMKLLPPWEAHYGNRIVQENIWASHHDIHL